MSLTYDGVIAAAALLAALSALAGYAARLWRGYDRVLRYDEDIRRIREEQSVLTLGVLACLKGLHEQGCNGPVTEAAERIESYLNARAHGGD